MTEVLRTDLYTDLTSDLILFFAFVLIGCAIVCFILSFLFRFVLIRRAQGDAQKELNIRVFYERAFVSSVLTVLVFTITYIVFDATILDDHRMRNANNIAKLCTRTERYPTTIKFNSAFDYIENHSAIKNSYENIVELLPCIHFKTINFEQDIGVDALISFDENEARENMFPIYVDENFDVSSDEVTSAILMHEFSLVLEYVHSKTKPDYVKPSCLQKLVSAYYFQTHYLLSQEELMKKLTEEGLKTVDNDPNTNPNEDFYNESTLQLTLSQFRYFKAYDTCASSVDPEASEAEFYSCIDENLIKNIEDFVYNEPAYREYCAYK